MISEIFRFGYVLVFRYFQYTWIRRVSLEPSFLPLPSGLRILGNTVLETSLYLFLLTRSQSLIHLLVRSYLLLGFTALLILSFPISYSTSTSISLSLSPFCFLSSPFLLFLFPSPSTSHLLTAGDKARTTTICRRGFHLPRVLRCLTRYFPAPLLSTHFLSSSSLSHPELPFSPFSFLYYLIESLFLSSPPPFI